MSIKPHSYAVFKVLNNLNLHASPYIFTPKWCRNGVSG
jgi:hypothetical protein